MYACTNKIIIIFLHCITDATQADPRNWLINFVLHATDTSNATSAAQQTTIHDFSCDDRYAVSMLLLRKHIATIFCTNEWRYSPAHLFVAVCCRTRCYYILRGIWRNLSTGALPFENIYCRAREHHFPFGIDSSLRFIAKFRCV